MSRRVLFITLLIAFSGIILRGQGHFPVISKTDLPDAELTGLRSFTEASLYGYIDGGAELYLEFGFDTLVVTEISKGAMSLKVEVYRMNDAEAAFGIFSVSRYHCNGGMKISEYYCRSKYQLQVCSGPYYISIINDNGTTDEQSFSNDIAEILLKNITEESFSPDRFFPEGVSEEAMKGAVVVRGALGVFNGIPSLSGTFEGAAGYTAMVVRQESQTLVSLRFDTEDGIKLYSDAQKINRDVLLRGEESAMGSGSVASMICLQHLLIKVD